MRLDLLSKLKWKRKDPEPPLLCASPPRRVYDLELCVGVTELKQCLRSINENGWILSAVTQDIAGIYTVVFSRFSYRQE